MKAFILKTLLRILNSDWAKYYPRGDYELVDNNRVFSLDYLKSCAQDNSSTTIAAFVARTESWNNRPEGDVLMVFEDGQWRQADVWDEKELKDNLAA